MSTGGDSHTWEKYPVSPTFSQIAPWEDTPNHYVPQGMGSNAWRGVQDYDPNMARYQRAVDTLKYVRWDILLENCTRVRNGITCRLEERFSVGNFKLVRRITFEDGYSWVVKVRMPPLDWQYDTEVMNDAKQIASEVANLKYLKAHSSIPVPEVYDYCTDQDRIGAPYILMEYIHGSTPVAFCGKPEHNACRFGTSDQDWNLREQIAAIQIALATMQFPQIGSLCQDRANGQVFIGKESRMGRGPWLDSLWFYHDLADSTMRKTVEVADRRVLGDYSAAVPALFKQVMATYVEGTAQHGPFGLLHLGLGAHNVLVDHNFRVVGLMDVGSIIAGPVEMQALYPACTRIGRKIPYCQVYQPQELHHLSMIQPRFLSTNECLKSARRILVRI